jgi:Protein of unknown function (DUF1565)
MAHFKLVNLINLLGLGGLVTLGACGVPGLAATYYVDQQGSDQAQGTQRSPWRTVNQALKSVAPDRNHIIQVGAGSFDLGGEVTVPSGIHLVGKGTNATTLQGGLVIKKTKQVRISQLRLDGKRYAYNTALLVRDAERLRLHDLLIQSYRGQALNIERVQNGKFYNTTITDSSFNHRKAGGGGQQSGSITMANLTDFDFHDLTIDTRARGGQGFGSGSEAWDRKAPWISPPAQLKRVRFYNLDIKVDQWNAWASGWTPQMALEIWHQTCEDCEIFNSTFNSTVSLAVDNPTRIRVHHNLWDGPQNPYYACETLGDNIEFDHNYVRNGTYPLAMFDKVGKRRNLKVHHNVFENTTGPTLVGHFLGRMEGFQFTHNTVYIKAENQLFYFETGEAPDQQIRNNIFYRTDPKPVNALNAKVGVKNNVFFNIKPVGENAMTFDPQLIRSGRQPAGYFRSRHPRSRELGAVKADNTDWRVGRNATLVRETPD